MSEPIQNKESPSFSKTKAELGFEGQLPKTGERVQKIIAQAGLASRREAEDLISEGLVTINGKTAKLGDKAQLGVDAIKVKGKLIHSSSSKVYYLYYKPKNVIAMVNEDEEGRPTIKDSINKRIKERVFTIGRMDFTGEGAILLTNDGELTQQILKSTDIIRRYHVKVDRHPTQDDLAKLARGGRIEGRSMNPFHVRVVEAYTRNSLIEVSFEGMGAIDVRKFFENKGFFPERVARVGIGHLSADKMKPGMFKRLQASSVKALLLQPELTKKTIEKEVKAQNESPRRMDRDGDKRKERKMEDRLFANVRKKNKNSGMPLPKSMENRAPQTKKAPRPLGFLGGKGKAPIGKSLSFKK